MTESAIDQTTNLPVRNEMTEEKFAFKSAGGKDKFMARNCRWAGDMMIFESTGPTIVSPEAAEKLVECLTRWLETGSMVKKTGKRAPKTGGRRP